MATMIPSPEKALFNNKSEEVFYRFFKNSPKTKDWTVFYSYRKRVARFGEVDFIAVIPGEGVIAIELKNIIPTKISSSEFIYDYNNVHTTAANPFTKLQYQALEIKNFLRQDPACGGTFVSHVIMFPKYKKEFSHDICRRREFYLNAQYFDEKGHPTEKLPDYLVNLHRNQKENVQCLPPKDIKEAIEHTIHLLTPVFEVNEREAAMDIADTLSSLNQDIGIQYKMLKDLPRALIRGGAGTGKTLIAFQKIKDARAAGIKTLFLCFNKLLGDSFKEAFRMCSDVKAGCIEEYMMRGASANGVKFSKEDKARKDFYYKILPEAFLQNECKKYDLLVVDEFQDLCLPEYIKVLDASVKGGLKSGNVWLLSDFEQNIFNKGQEKMTDNFAEKYNFAGCRINLCINYRNPSSITRLAENLVNTDNVLYDRSAVRARGSADEIIIYSNPQDQQEKLEVLIEKLLSKECGHRRSDIVILSAHSWNASDIYKMAEAKRGWGRHIASPEKAGDNNIRFTSVHRFKGLEANVVIITDIDDTKPFVPSLSTVLYTGVTRAKYKAIFLVRDRTENHFRSVYEEKK